MARILLALNESHLFSSKIHTNCQQSVNLIVSPVFLWQFSFTLSTFAIETTGTDGAPCTQPLLLTTNSPSVPTLRTKIFARMSSATETKVVASSMWEHSTLCPCAFKYPSGTCRMVLARPLLARCTTRVATSVWSRRIRPSMVSYGHQWNLGANLAISSIMQTRGKNWLWFEHSHSADHTGRRAVLWLTIKLCLFVCPPHLDHTILIQ